MRLIIITLSENTVKAWIGLSWFKMVHLRATYIALKFQVPQKHANSCPPD